MRVWMLALLVACGPSAVRSPQAPDAKSKITLEAGIPDGEAGARLKAAAEQIDAGKLTEAAAALEKLNRDHPNNALVLHELGLAYRLLKQPQKAIALWMPFRDVLPVDTVAALGSSLDEAGRRNEAEAVLRGAIKRYPNAGILYSELATSLRAARKYEEALALYEKSIEVDPAFPASYLHAATLYANTNAPGMALVYGETFRVLELTGERSEAVAEVMMKVCKDAVTLDRNKGTANIKLAPNTIRLDKPTDGLPVVNEFELAFGPGLMAAHMNGLKLKTLNAARRSFVDALKGPGKDSALAALPIMHWLLALDAAGHLEAYNYWLYGPAMPDEANAWIKGHNPAVGAMVNYVTSHPLFPPK